MDSLGFSTYNVLLSANNDNFTSFSLIWMLYIYISCLIDLVRTSNTMLNKSGKCRYPCLVPDRRVKALSFSLLSMMLAVGFSYVAFIMWSYVPSVPTQLKVFIINGCWILSNAFSPSINVII